ncbi:MAG: serine O-acetyltransferase [Phycisphaerales bacterium]|nr:serine O-acetyltransferase [Phycisphaerales bacterium]
MTDLTPNDHPATPDAALHAIAANLAGAMSDDARMSHAHADQLPDREVLLELLEAMRELVFPGFYGPRALRQQEVSNWLAARLSELEPEWIIQIAGGLAYGAAHNRIDAPDMDQAPALTRALLEQLPEIRRLLSLDVQAAYDGDPAARHTDEAILCYPGITALFVHRIAHVLYTMRVPLLPRILQEFAHAETGIDIHPGASIGESFFVDHGTGVVIGETTVIGDRCKVYQGVTLGARSFEKDERGQIKRGTKRHPTLGNDVTVYAGATVLGGDTFIGNGAVIAGGVFLTTSVPEDHVAQAGAVEIRVRPHHGLA